MPDPISLSESELKLPSGFKYAGVACGIKPSGKADISLIVADRDCVAAGVYTQNQVVAAPVIVCRDRTPSATIRAVITNSGNANACTGDQGMQDAHAMCQAVADAIGCDAGQVLVMSTGIIGQTLPMSHVVNGIASAAADLGSCEQSFLESADGILTTDKSRKVRSCEVQIGDVSYRIAAMAKGAGMIAPNMATMLATALTDAPLAGDSASRLLAEVANQSFNRVSVDGHTSTNDTLLLLSSGEGDALTGEELQLFSDALKSVCIELAKELVADGEGASHIMEINVCGAQSDSDADCIARTVAASPLVKTAVTGGDPNWGRIVSAAGYAFAKIDPQRTTLTILGTTIYQDGVPMEYDAAELSSRMKDATEVLIDLKVGDGKGSACFWSSDLTTDYVKFNSEYTT